ncbi:hypothetical protein H671_5g14192 [Cricetulus griseus]|nr:hypothetical protein H671_5g14192 [Cricetulus griseus]
MLNRYSYVYNHFFAKSVPAVQLSHEQYSSNTKGQLGSDSCDEKKNSLKVGNFHFNSISEASLHDDWNVFRDYGEAEDTDQVEDFSTTTAIAKKLFILHITSLAYATKARILSSISNRYGDSGQPFIIPDLSRITFVYMVDYIDKFSYVLQFGLPVFY